MRPAVVLAVVLAVSCPALRTVSCQSSAPNQQTGPKPLLGITVTQPSGLADMGIPANLTSPAILGPFYPLWLWTTRVGEKFAELEPPIQIRITAGSAFTLWESTVPYTEKSIGLFLNGTLRRPTLEHNDYYKNIALSYAFYKYANFMMPYYATTWNDTMSNLKLDVDNDNVDPTSPIGIGNLAALAVIRYMSTDGYNQLGDLTPDGGLINGNTYNRWNYSDYTLFEPANTAYTLSDPTKWQPLVIEDVPPYGGGGTGATGAPYVQHHITPHIGLAKRIVYSGDLPSQPGPVNSDVPTSAAYRAQVDQVLAYSANLTQVTKLQAEHFDSKLRSLGSPLFTLALNNKIIDLQHLIFLFLAGDMALMDANSEVWGQKIRFNSIRPISAIRYLYGQQSISAWGGPYKGTQALTGNEYRSYLKTMQHADYPSGSACYCSAWTNAIRGALGTDTFDFSITFTAGSSVIEPKKLPTVDTTLTWATLSDYNDQCGWSRVIGGVHFRAATVSASNLCAPIGKASYLRAAALRDGTSADRIDISTVLQASLPAGRH